MINILPIRSSPKRHKQNNIEWQKSKDKIWECFWRNYNDDLDNNDKVIAVSQRQKGA